MIETKYGTKDWDKGANFCILSIIVVDTWYTKSWILGDKNNKLEKGFYEGLAE